MATLEAVFEEFKQVPDWDRFPLPEMMYSKFNLKKPQPASVAECVSYTVPPHESLNKNGKVENRNAVEGGVRDVEYLPAPPVEVKRLNEETEELEDYPPPEPFEVTIGQSLDLSEYVASVKTILDDTTTHSS